jgi:Family of unknown function (DUF6113)
VSSRKRPGGTAGGGAARPRPPAPPSPRPGAISGAALLTYLGLGVLGVVVAAAGALVEAGWFPLGLLLALAGCSALFYGGTKLTRTRAGAGVPAATWVVSVFVLTMTRPEGDAVFPANIGFYVFLLVGVLAAVICATLPQLPPGGGPTARPGARPGR